MLVKLFPSITIKLDESQNELNIIIASRYFSNNTFYGTGLLDIRAITR